MNPNFYILTVFTLFNLFMVLKNNPEHSDKKAIENIKIHLQKQWLYLGSVSGLLAYGVYLDLGFTLLEIYLTLLIFFIAIPLRNTATGRVMILFTVILWGAKLIF